MLESTSFHPSVKDYEAKICHEATRRLAHPERTGCLEPFGDPLSGIVLIAERADEASSALLADALSRSLAAVKLDAAYVIWYPPILLEDLLSLEPSALVAVGPDVARAIDSLNYPLAKTRFSGSSEGSWFTWTKGTSGLRLPAVAPALSDADAKRRFWRAFLALRGLAPIHKELGSHS